MIDEEIPFGLLEVLKYIANDLLILSVEYQLKDKQIYCIRYNNNDYIAIYHKNTKNFFINDEIISANLKDVIIIGEFKTIYREYNL